MDDLTLKETLNLSYVPRWAIVPMMRHQSVAEHSWRVAIIAQYLCDSITQSTGEFFDVAEIVSMAMVHDVDEAVTGDMPSTIKDAGDPPRDVRKLIVKAADVIEARTWIRMWGHPSRVADVLASSEPKWNSILAVLDDNFPGSRMLALGVEMSIVKEGA